MRCKACDKMMNNKDLFVDDELCRYCLSSIRSDLNLKRYSKKKLELIDDIKNEEKKKDE